MKLLMADCESTGDIQAKLKKLFAGTIEQMLEAEMDEHLGYEKTLLSATIPETAETDMARKISPAITANVKYLFPVTAMVNLSLRSSKKDRLTPMKLSKKSWQCTQRECPSVTLKIP